MLGYLFKKNLQCKYTKKNDVHKYHPMQGQGCSLEILETDTGRHRPC